jgi:dihydroorotase (multifunctional complex type)
VVGFKAFLGPTVGDLPEPSGESLVRAMRLIAAAGLRLGVHAEDRASVEAGIQAMQAAGRRDAAAHADSRPPLAEVRAIDRVASLAATTGCPIHAFHLSSIESLAAVEAWRARGVDITCELTPHHAFLDSRDVAEQGTALRVNPPLRDPRHRDVLLRALAEGRIDLIATDHAPHERERKLGDDIWTVASGFPGVETSLALFLTEGVAAGRLTLEQLVRATSEGPARTWGLWPVKGTIALGSDADLTLIDLAREGVIHGAALHGRSDLTPWEGRRTLGAAVATIVRGEVVMRDGQLLGSPRGRAVSLS